MVSVRSDAYNDKKIWKLAEDDFYKVPEGFYYEANGDSSIKYYEDGPNTFYCAKSTEDATSTVNRYLAEYNEDHESLYGERLADSDVNETEKYFEFNLEQFYIRENQSSHIYRFRIFNCSYISDLHYGRYDKIAYNAEGSDPSKYAGKFATG